jgi:tripartite-type tricarboxylate transporter receptor subunit TctC
MKRRQFGLLAGSAVVAVGLLAAPAGAQSGTSYFAGKTINIHVGFSAGGNYDFYARLLAEHMGRHIPGNPHFLVQNRTGAGSRNAAAFVYNVAQKDGTAWGMTTNLLPLFQVLDPARAKFDLTKAQWIGNMVETNSVMAIWHALGVTTLDQAKKKEVIVGSTGRGGETYILPTMMNAVLGTKFRVVLGYPGINEISVAIEKGELHGRNGSYANLQQQRPQWLRDGTVKILVQIGVSRDPVIGKVPLLTELAGNDEDRAMLALVSSYPTMSRAFWMPATVPADRVAMLRRAFDATMKDPEFLRVAAARKADIKPNSGAAVQEIVASYGNLSPKIIARARNALKLNQGGGGKKKKKG